MTLGLSSLGLIALLALFRNWEKKIGDDIIKSIRIPEPVPQPLETVCAEPDINSEELKSHLLESEKKLEITAQQLQEKIEELTLLQNEKREEKLEADSLKKQMAQLKNLYNELQIQYQNMQDEQQKSSSSFQQMLESKQKLVENLEIKIRDLNYEIKTILKIAQEPSSR